MKNVRTPDGAAGSRLLGVGAYRPSRVVTNEEVCGRIDSSDEWIRRRSGVVTRRFADPGETVISMAAAAAAKAVAQAGIDASDVGMVLLASMSHLEQSPPAAPRVAELIGAHASAAMDVGAACAGFSHAVALADSLVRAGTAGHVVVVGSERMSDIIDPEDRGTAFLFGDGAGAVVVGPSRNAGIGPTVWGAEGGRHDLIAHDHSWLDTRDRPQLRPAMRMAGPEVFRWATGALPDIARRAMSAAGITAADLAAFIPHQANARIIDAAARALGLHPHTAVARDIVDSGNTSAASIPLAMDTLLSQSAAPSGAPALLIGFGAGLSYAAQVVLLP